MKNELRKCKNCQQDFTIESEDFKFYEKIKVPPPTWCLNCRMQRRMSWRNERSLYKRTCDLCKKNIIAIYPADAVFPVFCKECWYSDVWDSTSYGREYDFSRPFFEQFSELFNSVPRMNLWQRNATNSEFAHQVAESKNVYLSVSVIMDSENIFYSKSIDGCFNIFDSCNLKKCENCYENIECERNYNSQHMFLSRHCIDSYFLVDCVNCTNCFMCSNLRNKQYCIQNKEYSQEEYLEKIKEYNLESRESRVKFLAEFKNLCKKAIYRFTNNIKCVNSLGNNLLNDKNCRYCFDVYNSEDTKYSYRTVNMKSCMDTDYGLSSELMYEYTTGASNDYNVKFSYSALDNLQDADYTHYCVSSNNLFGCCGIRNKENVILNKVYSKEEYRKLRERIIEQMNQMPYIDKKGRIYKYGEFFPTELSPHAYNETLAQDIYPLKKDEAITEGYKWNELGEKNYKITISTSLIPDNIKATGEEIGKEILECKHKMNCNHQCLKAFRILADEFQFYKKNGIPIPDKCPNCRHYKRFAKIPPRRLWHRSCMCEKEEHSHRERKCKVEFETSYAPDRPETVYCETCYNQ